MKKEIDIVVEFPNGKSLIEVKFRKKSKLSKSDSIVEMCQKEKDVISVVLIIKKSRGLWEGSNINEGSDNKNSCL